VGHRGALGGRDDVVAFLRVRDLTWLDLVLPADCVAGLERIAAAAGAGGLLAAVSGPAGVGKTVSVRALAEQARLDTWQVDCRSLVEQHGEATPSLLPEVLAIGERPHAVLLFHDAGWLFEPVAGGAGESLLRLARERRPPTVLESRVQLCAPGVAALPQVRVPFPDEEARAELWRRLAWQAHPLLELDHAALAAFEVPGAVVEHVLAAALEGSPDLPTTDDVRRALEAWPGAAPAG
jgi:hypothetical protein